MTPGRGERRAYMEKKPERKRKTQTAAMLTCFSIVQPYATTAGGRKTMI